MEVLINKIALELIKKLVEIRYEYADSPDVMKMTIGEIGGIIEMANMMKEAVNDTRTGNQRD